MESRQRTIAIHGVSFFDKEEKRVREAVRENLAAIGYQDDEPQIVNWDIRMGNPTFPRLFGEMNLPFLLELGSGLFQSGNLGFLRFKGPYQGITPAALIW